MECPSDGVVVTVTASYVVSDRNCVVTGVSLNPAGASCAVSLYDPPPVTSAGGAQTTTGATLRVTLVAPASVASPTLSLENGIQFSNGCIAVVTGTGATATIAYAKI
jgi:hypothetical protein